MADPKKGTGKKPKGSGGRLYTDENPRDTVRIKFATPADARATVAKVKRVNKPFARKIQILTVMEQRAKVMGKRRPAMGGGMMMKRPGMKKGSIPPQLKKFVMAKKKKAAMKKQAKA